MEGAERCRQTFQILPRSAIADVEVLGGPRGTVEHQRDAADDREVDSFAHEGLDQPFEVGGHCPCVACSRKTWNCNIRSSRSVGVSPRRS